MRQIVDWGGVLLIIVLLVATPTHSQGQGDLVTEDITLVEEQDIYGQTIQTARGLIVNEGETAYTNISLVAQGFDDDDTLIAEGFGVLVNACGAGLLFDFALQPGERQPFSVPLELFETDVTPTRVTVEITAETTTVSNASIELPEGVSTISDQEVVAVEWEDEQRFRYAIGCERDLFTEWEWRRYDLETGEDVPIEHPYAELVDDTLRERLRLDDPLIFANSRLRFGPALGQRLVFQDRINDIYTATADGRFLRRLFTLLNSYSLQGYNWLPEDRFLAYYFGAFGDPVLYFTGDVEGRTYSRGPLENEPSVIVPGASRDGLRIIIGGTFDGVTGYFINIPTQGFFELLFESELPGNHYPAPVPLLNEAGDRVTEIYVVRYVDSEPRMQCFARPAEGENRLIDLAPVPLNIAIDEHAWSFLSPDERHIAISANGVNGGLWLFDLEALPDCEASS